MKLSSIIAVLVSQSCIETRRRGEWREGNHHSCPTGLIVHTDYIDIFNKWILHSASPHLSRPPAAFPREPPWSVVRFP